MFASYFGMCVLFQRPEGLLVLRQGEAMRMRTYLVLIYAARVDSGRQLRHV